MKRWLVAVAVASVAAGCGGGGSITGDWAYRVSADGLTDGGELSILRRENGTLGWIWEDFPQREELEQVVNLLGLRDLVLISDYGFGDPSYSHPSLSGEIEWSFNVEGRPASIVCQVTGTVSDDVTSASGQLHCPHQTWRTRIVDGTLEFGGSFSLTLTKTSDELLAPSP